MKIASLDITQLFEGSRKGQAVERQLRQIAERWQAKATAVEQKLAEVRKGLEAGGRNQPVEVRFKLERDGRLMTLELQQIRASAELELNGTREHLRAQLIDEAQARLKTLCEAQGITAVVTLPTREFAYLAPELDVTKALIELLDQGAAQAERPAPARPRVA